MGKVCEQIDMLVMGVRDTEQNSDGISAVYEQLLYDEVEHAQILTLQITNMLTQASEDDASANADEGEGSAFAAGDLSVTKAGPQKGEDGGEEDVK